MSSENIENQQDEVEALASIFGTDFWTEDKDNHVYCMRLTDDGDSPKYSVTLEVTMPPEYPSQGPPVYQLIAPWLRGEERQQLANELEEIYIDNLGESVIFMWADRVKDFMINKASKSEDSCNEEESDLSNASVDDEIAEAMKELATYQSPTKIEPKVDDGCGCPTIHSTGVITDRKSVFQGHLAAVHNMDQVKMVIDTLLSNKKIADATHNIQAYRILRDEDKKLFNSGFEDDGEFGAGGRMLHLLDIVDARDVIVVVTRWYGGVHLGPDRFKHINNLTRHVLLEHGYIKEKENKKGPKSKKH